LHFVTRAARFDASWPADRFWAISFDHELALKLPVPPTIDCGTLLGTAFDAVFSVRTPWF
jgi:hypothetical protein